MLAAGALCIVLAPEVSPVCVWQPTPRCLTCAALAPGHRTLCSLPLPRVKRPQFKLVAEEPVSSRRKVYPCACRRRPPRRRSPPTRPPPRSQPRTRALHTCRVRSVPRVWVLPADTGPGRSPNARVMPVWPTLPHAPFAHAPLLVPSCYNLVLVRTLTEAWNQLGTQPRGGARPIAARPDRGRILPGTKSEWRGRPRARARFPATCSVRTRQP